MKKLLLGISLATLLASCGVDNSQPTPPSPTPAPTPKPAPQPTPAPTPAPVVAKVKSFTINPANVVEGGRITLAVTLDNANGNHNLPIALSGQANQNDFTGPIVSNPASGVRLVGGLNGHLVVPAGTTQFTLTIPVLPDGTEEGSESYTFTIGNNKASGTINDVVTPSTPPAPTPTPTPAPAPTPTPPPTPTPAPITGDGSLEKPFKMGIGQSRQEAIAGEPRDVDYYSFQLQPGQFVELATKTSIHPNSTLQPYMVVSVKRADGTANGMWKELARSMRDPYTGSQKDAVYRVGNASDAVAEYLVKVTSTEIAFSEGNFNKESDDRPTNIYTFSIKEMK